MTDWQVGDLAAYDSEQPFCAACEGIPEDQAVDAPEGALRVVHVAPPDPFWGQVVCGITLEDGLCWCSCTFRKVVRDKHEACEPEFVELLKRTKQPVEGITISSIGGR